MIQFLAWPHFLWCQTCLQWPPHYNSTAGCWQALPWEGGQFHRHPSSTMAKEQPNVSDLLPLLESSDLHELDQIKSVLNDHLSTGQYSKFSIIPTSPYWPLNHNRLRLLHATRERIGQCLHGSLQVSNSWWHSAPFTAEQLSFGYLNK